MKYLLHYLLFFTICLSSRSARAQSFILSGPEVVCASTSATLTASGCAGTVQWSTGETTASITVSPTASKLYSATCTESGGQQQTKNHAVGVFPKPPLTASAPNLCANENVTLRTNTTEYTHSNVAWKRDGLPIVSGGGAYIANQAGTYTVEDTVTRGVFVPFESAPAGSSYRKFSFIDENNGWGIRGDKGLIKTTDGGQNWTMPNGTLVLATSDKLADVEFVNAATGWVIAAGKIFKTSDGGQTWVSQLEENGILLQDIFFLDAMYGWAAGSNYASQGVVLRTSDGGNTWQSALVGFKNNVKVQFVSPTTGWAIEGRSPVSYDGGGIFKTTDGGVHWVSKSPGSPLSFSCMYFQDANQGWAVSDQHILKTTNGGVSWSNRLLSAFSNGFSGAAIKIVDGVGWVFDEQSAYYTVNDGMSWAQHILPPPSQSIGTVHFFPSGKILAAGKQGLLSKFFSKSQSCLSSVTISPTLPAPKIIPSTVGALCQGESITLTASGCAGTLSWSNGAPEANITITPSATTSYTAFCEGNNGCRSTAYQGVAVVPKVQLDTASSAPCSRPVMTASQVWVDMDLRWKQDGQLLDYCDTGPYIPQSGGSYTAEADITGAWQPQASIRSSTYQEPGYPIDNLKDVQFINDSTGFIVGSGHQFLRTTDGGKNWIASKIPTQGDFNGYMFGTYSLHFIDAMQGWITGSFNDMEYYGEILRTTDGGISWKKIRLGPSGSGTGVNDVFFVKTPVGYPVGWGLGYSSIINSLDGGLTWTPQTSNTNAQLKTIFFLDDHTGWIGGANGTLLTTDNGGYTWTPRTIANVSGFESLHFLDASSGWAVAAKTDNGLYHTSDGGATWTQVPVDARHETYLKKVQFLNDSTGFVQGNKFIHATTDGGITWKKSYHHLNTGGMSFTDATHGWVIGGSIMTYVPAPATCASVSVTVLPESIAPLSTLISGSWDTPAVWSCGTIPTALDSVRINPEHTVTLPNGYSASAGSLELLGNIQQETHSNLRLGQK